MKRGLRLAAAAVALAAVTALIVALAGGRGDDEVDAQRAAKPANPHADVDTVDKTELARVLQAADAASTDVPRAELVAQGKALFDSTQLALAGESCAGCHTNGGGANAAVGTILHPQATGDFRGPRDVPSLWGVSRTGPWGWEGRDPSFTSFLTGTIKSHFVGGATQVTQDTAKTGRQVAALAAYLGTLDPPRSDFDEGTLSPAARRGEDLFQGKGACAGCHGGPLLTDNALHNTLVPKVAATDDDWGAAKTGTLRGSFNTPQLRDLRNTAPYMHNGSLGTLRDVVVFYNDRSSVAPLRLTAAEIDDLVAYLEAL